MGEIKPGAYFEGLITTFRAVKARDANESELGFDGGIELACALVKEAASVGKKVMFIGNGGSAGIASHMAVDFWKNGGIKAMTFNDSSILTCIGNDYGYSYVFEKPLEVFTEQGDILIAISSSGKSENILNGVRAAKAKGARIITLSGFGADNPLCTMGECNFYVPCGAYGPVELIHQAICHSVLDILMVRDGKLDPGDFCNG